MKIQLFAMAATVMALIACNSNREMTPQEGYIGPSDIQITDGHMSPEVLLSLGRVSDPQLSPDAKTILYGVSYTSIQENRSVRNLFTIPVEGGDPVQLTMDGKSISAARWSPDGEVIYFLQGGQLYKAPYREGRLGAREQLTDIPSGVEDYALSPDASQLMYVTSCTSCPTAPSRTSQTLPGARTAAISPTPVKSWKARSMPSPPILASISIAPSPEKPPRSPSRAAMTRILSGARTAAAWPGSRWSGTVMKPTKCA